MRKINWEAVNTADAFAKPTAGAYKAVITRVDDFEDRELIRVEWDYLSGEFANYNANTAKRAGFWPAAFVQSYKEKALPFFKRFKSSVEQSNARFLFDEDDVQALVGCLVGVVLGEEQYKKNNGGVGIRVYVHKTIPISEVDRGEYTIPPLKMLPNGTETFSGHYGNGYDMAANSFDTVPSFADIDDDDGELPF